MIRTFDNQLETLRVLRLFIQLRGYSPTLDELCALRGVSNRTAHKHICQLEQRGYVLRRPLRTWRNVRLTEKGRAA